MSRPSRWSQHQDYILETASPVGTMGRATFQGQGKGVRIAGLLRGGGGGVEAGLGGEVGGGWTTDSSWVSQRSHPLQDLFQQRNSKECLEIGFYTGKVIHWFCINTVLLRCLKMLLLQPIKYDPSPCKLFAQCICLENLFFFFSQK